MSNPVINPTHADWVNPAIATNQNGDTVAWDATSDMAGVEIQLDGQPAVSVVTNGAVTHYDLTQLQAYKALALGNHTLGLAVVTKEGAVSPFTGAVPFQIAITPLAPTGLVLA